MFHWVRRFFVYKVQTIAAVDQQREQLLLKTEARVRELDHQLRELLKEHEFRGIHKDEP
jgi:predicted transcriptional regulator